jgi:PHD/YefM family antitoxin component YafN of YafNO toxin-antitoxin module
MMVSGKPIDETNKGQQRVVFMEKCGKYLAWSGAETIEEAETSTLVSRWKYAKDIESPKESEKRELSEKISKLEQELAKLKNNVKNQDPIAQLNKNKNSNKIDIMPES